ncbi:hypothetical protein [Allonocardiopsis opalescens]|uniref:Uncharacterized protein n=1 Tax=Allonocardiopsis opalescens TaxID=1144618 RepID=A0A2T0PVZ4_9ACTN|nr:hypothetical protein [Allonocardiopsis opalescens]PRX95600.1 hypothetical protein CLV72_109209 [Allonocardiopsis opalescens]
MSSADDFLMGGGIPSAKFPTVGTTVSGAITMTPEVQQQRDLKTGALKTWDDGKPMQQLKVVLATSERDPEDPHDDGQRAVYVKGKMLAATRQAIRSAGAKGLEVGGVLSVTYTGDGEVPGRGMNPPKFYSVAYTPPAAASAADLLAVGTPAAPPAAPAPQAAPAPAPAAPVAQAAPDLSALTPEQIQQLLAAQAQQQAAKPPF